MKEVMEAADRFWGAWFKAVDQCFDLFLKSPAFVQGAGKAVCAGSTARARWIAAVESLLGEFRLASKDDVDRIAAGQHALEGKLNEVLLRMDEAALARAPAPAVEVPPVAEASDAVPGPASAGTRTGAGGRRPGRRNGHG